ncbi:metal-dependent hydrolase [Pasteurellaceae bacterium 15-036681]|nr:metal-dependent hydrolase [Pasteurellaceae bacterium 15-036681]
MNKNILSIPYGEQRLQVQLIERPQSKRLRLTVQPNGEIIAYAPQQAVKNELIFAISQQTSWISQQLAELSQLPKLPVRQYISGESHRYLGRQYVLKVYNEPNQANHIRLWRGQIEVQLKDKSPEKVRKVLNQWYRQKAKQIFQQRLEVLLAKTLWVTDEPNIRLRTMKTRWGSCSVKGALWLNPMLVKAPKECIDYVILHELCHLAEHNHSERFYRLMDQVMPNWQEMKKRLDNLASILLVY